MKEPKCLDCGLEYRKMGLDLVLPDQQWIKIAPEGKGTILCANCICKRAAKNKRSITILAWIK